MVYSSKFVVCVLVNNKIQSERKDGIVPINFGNEYSLRFRNKHERQAVVKFSIDGEDVSGPGYIVPAHGAVDIHRHYSKDARFKFVSIDSEAAIDYGKNDNSDGSKGVVEARFFLEKITISIPDVHHHHHHYPPPQILPIYPPQPPWSPYKPYGPIWLGANSSECSVKGDSYSCSGGPESSLGEGLIGMSAPCSSGGFDHAMRRQNMNRVKRSRHADGCTVEGNVSGQTFSSQYIDLESDFTTLRLVLKGITSSEEAVSTVVEECTHCTNCGAKRLRKSDKFCGSCGQKL